MKKTVGYRLFEKLRRLSISGIVGRAPNGFMVYVTSRRDLAVVPKTWYGIPVTCKIIKKAKPA